MARTTLKSNVVPLRGPANPAVRAPPQRLSPDELLTFAAVARAGGVRSGAEALGMPRSTVSRQLTNLEAVLGGRLVTRTTRRFALTDLGRELLRSCEQLEEVLRAAEEAARRGTGEPSGLLRVAASPIVGEEILPALVAEYLELHPRVRVQLELSPDFVDLRTSGIDLAIRTGEPQAASDVYATRLGESVKGHYASPAYLARRGLPSAPADLEHHDCVVVGKDTAWDMPGAPPAKVHAALRVNSYATARAAAVHGAGIARLPTFYVKALVEAGELVPLLEAWPMRMTVVAVHAAGKPAPPKIAEFVRMLRVAFGRHL